MSGDESANRRCILTGRPSAVLCWWLRYWGKDVDSYVESEDVTVITILLVLLSTVASLV